MLSRMVVLLSDPARPDQVFTVVGIQVFGARVPVNVVVAIPVGRAGRPDPVGVILQEHTRTSRVIAVLAHLPPSFPAARSAASMPSWRTIFASRAPALTS